MLAWSGVAAQLSVSRVADHLPPQSPHAPRAVPGLRQGSGHSLTQAQGPEGAPAPEAGWATFTCTMTSGFRSTGTALPRSDFLPHLLSALSWRWPFPSVPRAEVQGWTGLHAATLEVR